MLEITAPDAIAALSAILNRLDVGAGNPVIEIYDGAKPASIGDAVTTQNLLIELDMDDTQAFQAPVDMPADTYVQATANPIADKAATASGQATWFRLLDSAGNVRWMGDVSEANLGGDLQISSVNIIQDVNVVTVAFRARYPKK